MPIYYHLFFTFCYCIFPLIYQKTKPPWTCNHIPPSIPIFFMPAKVHVTPICDSRWRRAMTPIKFHRVSPHRLVDWGKEVDELSASNLRKAIKRDAIHHRRYLPPRNYDVIDGFDHRAEFNRRKETNALCERAITPFSVSHQPTSSSCVNELFSNLHSRQPCIQICRNLEKILISRFLKSAIVVDPERIKRKNRVQ